MQKTSAAVLALFLSMPESVVGLTHHHKSHNTVQNKIN